MYCYSSFSRRYIGMENSMPIPMYGTPNLSIIYIGMSQYRPFPMYRQISPSQNTSEFIVFSQSRCIPINFPRIYLLSLAVCSRASQPHFNFPRIYLHPLAIYPRANQPHFNFPRLYFHPLEVYSRANQPHITQQELYIMYSSRYRTPDKTITQNFIFL